MNLPPEDNLQIGSLAAVFNETTNSYKFYWFLAILDEIEENNVKVQKTVKLTT